jgi:hypothetical protein
MNAFRLARLALPAIAAAMLCSSCMSLDMIAHAEGKAPPTDPQGRPYDAMPGYYALVPLVLPLDLITLPVQYFYFQSARAQHEQGPPPPPPPPQYQVY